MLDVICLTSEGSKRIGEWVVQSGIKHSWNASFKELAIFSKGIILKKLVHKTKIVIYYMQKFWNLV
jgi:hypothetical protein